MQSPTSPVSYTETSVSSFSKEPTKTTTSSHPLPHANLLTPPTLTPPTITSDLPTSTLSPNHHNYYTHYLNKAQFNSILVNCSINLLKILYKDQKFDEKSIKLFIIEILRRSKTSIQSLQLSCFYIYKLIVVKEKITFDAKKLFLGLIIISSKFNQDYNYSFKSWCKICGLNEKSNVKQLIHIESTILQWLKFDLCLIGSKYENWCNLLLIFGYDFIKYQLIFDNRTEIVWNQEIKDKINSWQGFFNQLNLDNLNIINVNFNNYFNNQLNKKVFVVKDEQPTILLKKRSSTSLFDGDQPVSKKVKV
ncbi:G1/S-specific cyclin, putative [Candida dubliniensis CD36]|uniref:Cyclin, putative n=1 Tax=Candida dubliniensis (strain CD36 / ATCC MYA-646 / CBS 7987 / NCPF 3949 / NRRL Y-17841) TaxID=573826 RepID=B9WI61_CANDC|nr:G1/S-specific cyclin, putative [Candida dubliniensis CD36]CAX41858.1 G1/S-specific cyclin, putative [Candida dubliniensis CD36]